VKKQIFTKKLLREYAEITLGVVLMSIAIQLFFVSHNLVTGGISGLGIIFYSIWQIPLGLTTLIFNVPLFLLSFKMMGIDIFIKSLYTMLIFALFLELATFIPNINPSIFLSVTIGSATVGLGTALIIRNNATSGGTVLIARLLEKVFGRFKITTWILMADMVVILTGMYVFSIINTLYAILCIFVFTKVADIASTGAQNSKAMYVFSNKSEEVAQAMLKHIDRGITSIPSKGVYTGEDRDLLLCVMSNKELIQAKGIVHEVDSKAFIVITSAHEVFGEGFKPLAE